MKKYFFLLSIFIFSIQLPAQILLKDNEPMGINKLVLGESKEKYMAIVPVEGGKYTKDNHTFTIYGYGESVEIDGTLFNSNLLTFDDSNRLASIVCLKFYRKKDSPAYEKEAKKRYQQIIDFVTKQVGRKGANKIYYISKKITDAGQEWNTEKVTLKVKKTSSVYNTTIEFSLSVKDI